MAVIYYKQDFKRLIPLAEDVYGKLAAYHDLLVKWQKAINLVSPKTIPESWHRHFLDSAQVAKYVPEVGVLADLGCGAGFPGLVLAMMKPQLNVHLVESDERKGQFMRTVSRETGLKNITIHSKRVEDVTNDFTPNFVTARALASLDVLLDYVAPWAIKNPSLACCFLKGRGAEDEIAIAQRRYDFSVESRASITDAEAQILSIHSIGRR